MKMFGIVLMSISVTATLASLEPIGFGQSAETTHSSYPYQYVGAVQPSLKASRPSAFVGKYLPPPPLLPTTAATTTTTTIATTARASKTNRNPSTSQHQQHQLLSAQGRVQATSNDVAPSINYLPVMDKPRPPSKEYLPPRQSQSSYLPPSREYLPAALSGPPTATAATTTETTTTLGLAATTFGSEYLPPSSVSPTRPSFFVTTPSTRLKNEYLSPTQVIASSTRRSVIDPRNEYLPPTNLSPPYRSEDRLTEQRQRQQQPKFRALASNEPGINLVDDNYLTAVTTATEINDAIAARGSNYQYAAPTSTESVAKYNFEYRVSDEFGNDFAHKEQRQGARIQGSYSVLLPDGRKQRVSYEADEHGFMPRITYEEAANVLQPSASPPPTIQDLRQQQLQTSLGYGPNAESLDYSYHRY